MEHKLERISTHMSFKGEQRFYRHYSNVLGRTFDLAIYVPVAMHMKDRACPVLYYLPGLITPAVLVSGQSDYQRYANRYDVMVVTPDIFVRYSGSTNEGRIKTYWQEREKICAYLCEELPALIESHFQTTDKRSIMGYAFGGTLALNLALAHPKEFQSVSAFAPWIGFYHSAWFEHNRQQNGIDETIDPIEWFRKHPKDHCAPIWIDQGMQDSTIGNEVHLDALSEIQAQHPQQEDVWINYREHYDRSFYFVHSHIREHFVFHSEYLDDTPH